MLFATGRMAHTAFFYFYSCHNLRQYTLHWKAVLKNCCRTRFSCCMSSFGCVFFFGINTFGSRPHHQRIGIFASIVMFAVTNTLKTSGTLRFYCRISSQKNLLLTFRMAQRHMFHSDVMNWTIEKYRIDNGQYIAIYIKILQIELEFDTNPCKFAFC